MRTERADLTEALYDAIDTNKDGAIDADELAAAVESGNLPGIDYPESRENGIRKRNATMRGEDPITMVGAGPTGLACAIVLARGGRRVTVREWKDRVGHRFHDDFQGLENWTRAADVLDELAGLGIAADFERHGFDRRTVFDPTGRHHDVHGQPPLFYLVRRGQARARATARFWARPRLPA